MAPMLDPGSRKRLTPRSVKNFPGESLFAHLARAVCQADGLPRKELFEAWEMARRVRRQLRGGRVVDLAAGHGLLAWTLLLLDDSSILLDESVLRQVTEAAVADLREMLSHLAAIYGAPMDFSPLNVEPFSDHGTGQLLVALVFGEVGAPHEPREVGEVGDRITSAAVSLALNDNPSESPTKSATSCSSGTL